LVCDRQAIDWVVVLGEFGVAAALAEPLPQPWCAATDESLSGCPLIGAPLALASFAEYRVGDEGSIVRDPPVEQLAG
jgi:hypothetical protein